VEQEEFSQDLEHVPRVQPALQLDRNAFPCALV
jgi:hypothetical protein